MIQVSFLNVWSDHDYKKGDLTLVPLCQQRTSSTSWGNVACGESRVWPRELETRDCQCFASTGDKCERKTSELSKKRLDGLRLLDFTGTSGRRFCCMQHCNRHFNNDRQEFITPTVLQANSSAGNITIGTFLKSQCWNVVSFQVRCFLTVKIEMLLSSKNVLSTGNKGQFQVEVTKLIL